VKHCESFFEIVVAVGGNTTVGRAQVQGEKNTTGKGKAKIKCNMSYFHIYIYIPIYFLIIFNVYLI
jgi:hypothetical protein